MRAANVLRAVLGCFWVAEALRTSPGKRLFGLQAREAPDGRRISLQNLPLKKLPPLRSSVAPEESGQSGQNKKNPGPLQKFTRLLTRLVGGPEVYRRIWARYLMLSPFQRVFVFAFIAWVVETLALGLLRLGRGPVAAKPDVPTVVPYSTFLSMLQDKGVSERITSVLVNPTGLISFRDAGELCWTQVVNVPQYLVDRLSEANITFLAEVITPGRGALTRFISLLLNAAYIVFLFMIVRRSFGGSQSSPAKKLTETPTTLTFDDVAGVDQAKGEVREIVTMLRDPQKYLAAGARIPAGVLLVGPPGTGKTLLARCMAGEARVPFFYCTGSDFVEMFVGRGAARVRTLFEKAKKASPCILFIDELDALGKQRSFRLQRGNDEAEQTLNQLLACMDGLDKSGRGIIVLGATNRYDILDEALTRPGRFDRIVTVNPPDRDGRRDILQVHCRKLNLAPSVDLRQIANLTPGLTGAELESICNEAAIRAVRRSDTTVLPIDFEEAAAQFYSSRRKSLGMGILEQLYKGQG
uniref:AAA+ ATPase domain-containing protein n=1 Tax=Pinguiococcus pyrenoidosus TaxID=172671 RepID=A0A7R9U5K1_9STRA